MQQEKDISLNVLLVDTARNEGVLAVLTLESVRDGSGELYPIPELAFMSSADFQHAQHEAGAWAENTGLWRTDRDVRWQLRRRDGETSCESYWSVSGSGLCAGHSKVVRRGVVKMRFFCSVSKKAASESSEKCGRMVPLVLKEKVQTGSPFG